MSTYTHTITLALSINGALLDDRGRILSAFIPPLLTIGVHLPEALYAALGDAATWARAAWDVLAGPGWGADLGLMWEAARLLLRGWHERRNVVFV
jgi:hypothetical protein